LNGLGHEVRLMPAQYVKPYVKTNKHDAADAEGCCEAVQRPSMRFVPVKSETQQALLMRCIGSGIGWSRSGPAPSARFAGTWPSSGSSPHVVGLA
jgi:hypothetical protein